jgi:amino acid adenylation domain-containing protein
MRVSLLRTGEREYRMVWSHHHIVMDGWSLAKIVGEVLGSYGRGKEERQQERRQERRRGGQYESYVRWLKGQEKAAAEQYWREELKGVRGATRLRVEEQWRGEAEAEAEEEGGRYREEELRLSREESVRLEEKVREARRTMNAVVQGAWALLLSRYSGEAVVVYGTTVSGRAGMGEGVEEIKGLLINTVVVKQEVREGEEVRRWLGEVERKQWEQREYEYVGLAEVQGWSEVGRGEELIESLLVYENYPVEKQVKQSGKRSFEIRDIRSVRRTNYPITVTVAPGEELSLSISYDSQRYDTQLIKQILTHLKALIKGLVEHPEKRISEVEMLRQEERREIVEGWNETRRGYDKGKSIQALVEEAAAKRGGAIAVEKGSEQVSYGELNRRANQLGNYLRRKGVVAEQAVGICLERGIDTIVAVLAVLKAGGAYVPMDYNQPKQRLKSIIENANLSVIITREQLLNHLPEHPALVVCLDRDHDAINKMSECNLPSITLSESLAYIIFTSGSAGTPKGVMIQQASLVNLAHALEQTVYENSDDSLRVAVNAPFVFDASVKQLIQLVNGRSVHIIPEEVRLDGNEFLSHLGCYKIDVLDCTPSQLRPLIESRLWGSSGHAVRLALVGGEAIDDALWQTLASHTATSFYNVYGPTECTVDAAVSKIETGHARPTIGHPIPNVKIYLLDKALHPVPIRVAGELYISGAGLARGYVGHPDLTAERFVPDLFSGIPGARMYKSGDLACYRPDGSIAYMGRIDNQVKIRGHRVEPNEVSSVLSLHPAIKEAVTVAHEDAEGNKRLVAYIVAQPGQTISDTELRTYAKGKLPDYMVPSAFMLMAELPLTRNGKLDLRALPLLDEFRSGRPSEYVAPRTELEIALADLWRAVLKVEAVGVHDNFFELGGDSIKAISLGNKLQQRLGEFAYGAAIFKSPTVASLAAYINDHCPAAASTIMKTESCQPIPAMNRGDYSLDQMLEELDQLSEDEAQSLLNDQVEINSKEKW